MSRDFQFALGQLIQALSISRDLALTYKDKDNLKKYIGAADCWYNELKDILNEATKEENNNGNN